MFDSQYYLPSTGDTTDRTAAIEEKLTKYGVCMLGHGIYAASGVKMPEGSALVGIGNATKLLLNEDVETGYAVRLDSYCTVRDLSVVGSLEEITAPDAVGTRHGIGFLGTATPEDYTDQPHNAVISGCFISGFSGGGITCTDTGYSSRSAMTVSDCHIQNCGAGINISHFSEYHMFTNVMCHHCLYGCINNGGNNRFVNCGFDSNVVGFLIDNSRKQSINDSHGSVVGCSFNHSDGNQGVGIYLRRAKNGYSFTGCQLFFSKIVVEGSENILFSGFNIGKNAQIRIDGGKLIMFSDCVFGGMPRSIEVADDPLVHFDNCYTRDGEPVGAEFCLN